MKRDAFSGYNPYINMLFYTLTILFAVVLNHPITLAESFVFAILYAVYLSGKKIIKKLIFFIFPMMLIGSLINPIFNHRGQTILFYFNDNPMTLEAMAFGVGAAFMIGSVIFWFESYNLIMTSDKLMYVFGKIASSMSLIFSMVLRFIPHFSDKLKKIANAQKNLGRDFEEGNLIRKAKKGMKILSIMTTWGLENSVDLADSMKSRGYGLKDRSNFLKYGFDGRDLALLIFMTILAIFIVIGAIEGYVTMEYYPLFELPKLSVKVGICYLTYGIFCSIPIMVGVYEDIKWKYLKSKI